MRTAFAAILLAALHTAPLHAGERPAGYDRIDVETSHRSGLVQGSIWYPADGEAYSSIIGEDAVFVGTPALSGARIADGAHPLLLLSHGSGGNMDNLAWLSSALAQKGMMVLAVNHPGSTSGDSSPRRSIFVEKRAADLSAALDGLQANPAFAPHIDPKRIYTLGFSMGGATALQLAGLRLDRDRYGQWCSEHGDEATDCRFFARGGVDILDLHEGFGADMGDARIKGAIAVDPGLVQGMSEESIAALALPVLLIQLGDPENLPIAVDTGPHGSRLADRLVMAERVEITPSHHFSFLGLCRNGAEKLLEEAGEDPICMDADGSERQTVHARIIDTLLDWLARQ